MIAYVVVAGFFAIAGFVLGVLVMRKNGAKLQAELDNLKAVITTLGV